MPPLVDLKGKRFGRLTVIRRVQDARDQHVQWFCRCDCGEAAVVRGKYLKSGHTQSCGCLQRERVSQALMKHGMSEHPLHNVWENMKGRCYDPKCDQYRNYGARGIVVCKEWLYAEKFFEWALAHGWKQGLTIERIDNDGNYEPGNCRWATYKEQNRNRRNNRWLECNGKKMLLTDWAAELGMSPSAIHVRLKLGWSLERALTVPPKLDRRRESCHQLRSRGSKKSSSRR